MDKKKKRLVDIIYSTKDKHSKGNLVLAIPRFMSKSFTSYCSMREDLLLIKQFMQRLEVEPDKVICSSLTYSTISLYGKCFTDATNTKAPKLEPKQIFVKESEFRSTHDYLMNLRHHFIAHRGDTASEVEIAYLLVPKEQGELQVRYSRTKQMRFTKSKIAAIIDLVDYLIGVLEDKIQKSGQKTYEAYLKHFTPEEMAFMLINNIKDK